MSDNRVTQGEIDALMDGDMQVWEPFPNLTVVALRLANGFTVVESSGCIDPANYDRELGVKYAMERIENRVWQLEGYRKLNELTEKGEL